MHSGNPPLEPQKATASRSAPAAPVVASDGDGYNYKVFPDGSRYEGQWKDGLKHGKGRFIYPDGDVYDGEWQDGKAHGHGTYTSKQSKYVGDWQSDLKHGQAVEEGDDTSKYTGTYSHGQKHGKGRFEWPDGSVYDGEFRNNNVEGEGTFTWKDGRQYKGQWVDSECMARAALNGLMAGPMKVSTLTTSRREKAPSFGQMGESSLGNGRMANNMASASFELLTVINALVSGGRACAFAGWTRRPTMYKPSPECNGRNAFA